MRTPEPPLGRDTSAPASAPPVGRPFDAGGTARILEQFCRDGFCVIPGVLEADEVAALREHTDRLMADADAIANGYVQSDHILRHPNELHPLFLHLLAREPIYSLMHALFGDGFEQCGMNVLRSGRGASIDRWHVDDDLFFPLPAEVPRHDARIRMPVFWLTVQVALSGVERRQHGPTQYVPGSHYSGRRPPADVIPSFEGVGPRSIFCSAGDIYLHDPQCWHRGAPNDSDRVRYLLQSQYGSAWGFLRYNAYLRHRMPDELMANAGERVRGLIGPMRSHPEDRYR